MRRIAKAIANRSPSSLFFSITGLLLLLAAFVVIISGLGSRQAESTYRYAEQLQSEASAYTMVPISGDSSVDALIQEISGIVEARFDPVNAPSAEARSALRDETGQDLWNGALRLAVEYLELAAAGDYEPYAAWRIAQGYSIGECFITSGDRDEAFLNHLLSECTGQPILALGHPSDYVRAYYESYWQRGGGDFRPDGLPIDRELIDVQIGEFTHWADSFGTAIPEGGLGIESWYGGIATGSVMLSVPSYLCDGSASDDGNGAGIVAFDSPFAMLEGYLSPLIDAAGGRLPVAQVKIIYRSRTGLNIPATFNCVRSVDGNRWELIGIALNNVGSEVGSGSVALVPPPL
ncbi:MAG: hypothetical protein AAGB51_03165 [Planctomycetota bacterium]